MPKSRWYPDRDCERCDGLGFVMIQTERGNRAAVKCGCWWKWTDTAQVQNQVRDGKMAAAGQ